MKTTSIDQRTARPLRAVISATGQAGLKKQLPGMSRWLMPLAILCCMVNTGSADTFGLFTYTDEGTTITITGYTTSAVSAVEIPATIVGKPVTSIGVYAFYHFTSLQSVTIPAGVTSIGGCAFEGSGLRNVTIPNSVTSIGDLAFSQTPLSNVTIPNSVTTIGSNAFLMCGLTSVTIPASVTTIGDQAFYGCRSLKTAVFQGNAPTMGWIVFGDNANGFTVYYVNGMTGFSTPLWTIHKYGGYYTVQTFPGAPPQFTSDVPPATGKTGTVFSHTCSATGTPAPTIAVTSGALPNGLTISSAGVISGYPSVRGIFTGTITASNGIPPDATQAFTIDTNEYRTLTTGGTHGTATGGGIYLLNATATLTATPSPGYLFTNWSGAATGTANPLSIQIDANKTITANFGPDTNDTDGDGWTNYQEIVEHATDPTKPDTDNDGVKDSMDAFPLDPAETLDTDHDGIGDNADPDDDGDGLSDVDELNTYGTNPKRADSDGDGLSDPDELQVYQTNPILADMDNDGLSDGAEVNTHHTNPKVGDSDGDGFLDGYEVLTGHLPLVATDKPALVADARTAIEFTFPAASGKTYRIEGSFDLTTWTTVEDGIAGNGWVIQRFYTTRDMPKRYFRVEESAP